MIIKQTHRKITKITTKNDIHVNYQMLPLSTSKRLQLNFTEVVYDQMLWSSTNYKAPSTNKKASRCFYTTNLTNNDFDE